MLGEDSLFPDPKVDAAILSLRSIPGWPYDEVKDERLVRSLIAEYPYADLAAEISRWRVWYEKEQPVIKNWHARIRTALKLGGRWGVERRENRIGASRSGNWAGGTGAGSTRSSSRAGTVSEHGGTSGRLDDW